MIRPAALTIKPPEAPEVQLLGHVSDVAFRGRGYEHAVLLDSGNQLLGIFSPTRGSRGDRVGRLVGEMGAQLFDALSDDRGEGEFSVIDDNHADDPGLDLSKEFTRMA